MINRNLWLSMVLLLALALVIGACSSQTPAPTPQPAQAGAGSAATQEPAATQEAMAQPVTIQIWFHSGKGAERDALQATIDKFNSSQTDVQVEAVQLPEGSYNDQVNAGALAGDLPCALDFDGPNLYNYAWSEYLIPIDDYV